MKPQNQVWYVFLFIIFFLVVTCVQWCLDFGQGYLSSEQTAMNSLYTKFSLILEKIGFPLVSGFLRSTVVDGDCCFNNLCRSHLQSQVRHSWAQTIFNSKVLTVL